MTEIIVIIGGFILVWFLPFKSRRSHARDELTIDQDLDNQDRELAAEEIEAGVELTGPLTGVPELEVPAS